MKVIYYGKENPSLRTKFFSIFGEDNSHLVILDNKVGEENVVNYAIKKYNITDQGVIFINFDSMKLAYNFDLNNIINHVNVHNRGKSNYFIFFNRYLDSGNQVKYLGEISSPDTVSLFESFNPGNSDAFFIEKGIVKTIYHNLKTKRDIFDLVRKGAARGFSFSPNLVSYNFRDSVENNEVEFSKSTTITKNDRLNFKKINHDISMFFSDHVLIFWIFIVFFICLIFLMSLRQFKLLEKYL